MTVKTEEALDTMRRPGRPRSQDISTAVLRVALNLAYDHGIEAATIERIAQQSGVAKTTIYRRWPSAGAVVMDAFMSDIAPEIPYREEKTIALTFQRAVQQLIKALDGQRGTLLRQLLAAAQVDGALRQVFLEKWVLPRRAQAREVIARAQERGEFKKPVDVDVLIDVIFGAVYYRLLMPYAGLNREFAGRLARQVFAGVSLDDDPAPASARARK